MNILSPLITHGDQEHTMGMDQGGENYEHPRIRRCGSAVVAIDSSGNLQHAAFSILPGEHQTVPRSELTALIILLTVVI